MNHNIQDHQDHCCIIHGCSYNQEDCPVFTGDVKANKKKPCKACEELYGDSKIMYEVTTYSSEPLFFDKQSKIRSWMTSCYLGGWLDRHNNAEPEPNREVTEYKLVPIRKVSLKRFIDEYKAFKGIK
jgi:hypothetical protein